MIMLYTEFLLLLISTYNVSGFIMPHNIRTSETALQSDLFADVTPTTQPSDKVVEDVIHLDINGKEISVGSLIAIASTSNPIKAHSVHESNYGQFDPISQEFIPQDKSTMTRATSCLVLPVGLRGEVTKIYNTNEWDRTHPILVNFKTGEESGYNLPKAFSLHVDANEVEVL